MAVALTTNVLCIVMSGALTHPVDICSDDNSDIVTNLLQVSLRAPCTNNPPPSNAQACAGDVTSFCTKNGFWTNNQFCEESCYQSGLAYDEDCAPTTTAAITAAPPAVTIAAPITATTAAPITVAPIAATAAPIAVAPVAATTAAPSACPANCKVGYTVPSLLNYLESALEPLRNPNFGGMCADGEGGVKPCYDPAVVAGMNQNCSKAQEQITAMRKADMEYKEGKLDKCKKSLEEEVLCTIGTAVKQIDCNNAFPGDPRDKAAECVKSDVTDKSAQEKDDLVFWVHWCWAATR